MIALAACRPAPVQAVAPTTSPTPAALAADSDPSGPHATEPDPPPPDLATALAQTTATQLAAPPWEYSLTSAANVGVTQPPPVLTEVSRQGNRKVDEDQWFAEHGVALPVHEVPNHFLHTEGQLPPGVPALYAELPIVEVISHPDHRILLYGPDYGGGTILAMVGPDETLRALWDFTAWRRAPSTAPGEQQFVDQRIVWAQAVGDVVYVSTSHRAPAKSSGGHNGYLAALDLNSGAIRWRSQPLVANARNFVVRDGWILTGYGFTEEPDFLYVLHGATGRVEAQHKLKSGPDLLLAKDNQLFVRCYDTDYVFELGAGGEI